MPPKRTARRLGGAACKLERPGYGTTRNDLDKPTSDLCNSNQNNSNEGAETLTHTYFTRNEIDKINQSIEKMSPKERLGFLTSSLDIKGLLEITPENKKQQ